jgi:hypothetical protein
MMEYLLGGVPTRPALFTQRERAEYCDTKIAILSDVAIPSMISHPEIGLP